MQILNIDAFAQVTREISLAGVTYAIEEPTVQQFIDNLKASEALEASASPADKSFSKSFEQAVDAICQAIPTMSSDIVRGLKVPAMTAVMKFIRGEMDPAVASQATPAADATPAEGDVAKNAQA